MWAIQVGESGWIAIVVWIAVGIVCIALLGMLVGWSMRDIAGDTPVNPTPPYCAECGMRIGYHPETKLPYHIDPDMTHEPREAQK